MRGLGARFVYILRSETDPARHYVGRATNVDERLAWHNAGPCGHTIQHRPWLQRLADDVVHGQTSRRPFGA